MIKEIEKQIALSEEVLNNLPKNNLKNVEAFKREVDLEIKNYEKKADTILEELKRRIQSFENLKYEEIPTNKETLEKLKKALKYTNTLNTPFEKLNFDKIIYRLSHYENEDLIDNNRHILKAINIFKATGVNITINDFNYTSYVNDYMQMFFEPNLTTTKIKNTFDSIYWKCPNIMIQIELNLRSIYYKYIKKTETYIKNICHQLDEKFKANSILENYNIMRKTDENYINKTNLILDFYTGKLDINDYTNDKISETLNKLFTEKPENNQAISIIKQLKNSLVEYKNYLKYKDLIEKIKTLYNENLEKDYLQKTTKKIKTLESKLFKLDKKFSKKATKTSVDKVSPLITAQIEEIKNIYTEIDNTIFKVIIKNHIKENSTIFKALLLISQYYVVLADYFKEKNPEITYEQIDQEIDSFYNYLMNPNNTIINNMTILDERSLDDIIVTNYKMLNIKIDETLITIDNIDNLIEDLDKIIMSNNLNKLNIKVDELEQAKLIKNTIDKK